MKTMEDRELLWKRYSLHVDLYKFYFDLVVKLNMFYYGITGALISYYFTSGSNRTISELSLIFPLLMGIGLVIFFMFGDRTLKISLEDIEDLADRMELERYVRTDSLNYILKGSAGLVFIVVISLLFLMVSDCLLSVWC